jgi:hypothetical protein
MTSERIQEQKSLAPQQTDTEGLKADATAQPVMVTVQLYPRKKVFFFSFVEILLACRWLEGACRLETSLEHGADTTSIYQTTPTPKGIAPIPGTGQSRVGL